MSDPEPARSGIAGMAGMVSERMPCGNLIHGIVAGLVHIYSKVIRSYLNVFHKTLPACGKQIKPVFLGGESRAAPSAFGFKNCLSFCTFFAILYFGFFIFGDFWGSISEDFCN